MAVELHVSCELPTCDETAKVERRHEPDFDFSTLTQVRDDGTFFFIVDSDWEDPPDGWTATADGSMRCPRHRGL